MREITQYELDRLEARAESYAGEYENVDEKRERRTMILQGKDTAILKGLHAHLTRVKNHK